MNKMFSGFSDQIIEVSTGVKLRVRTAGEGPAVLLLHGYPQTHACWHKVAPQLVQAGFHVVLADLRGYGDSDKPDSAPDHAPYSKRAMGEDQIALMRQLGHETFFLAGHDRGARVAHRMARDYPETVRALAVLDIAPTAHMYANTNMEFASGYYHWFFLIQPAPLPEKLIGADPVFYLKSKLHAWSKGNDAAFTPDALAEYERCFTADMIAASCEDYRAAATIDLQHDGRATGGKLLQPLLALWGSKGLVAKLYDVIGAWEEVAENVRGAPLPCGHFLPEEEPGETARLLVEFFRSLEA